MTKRPTANSRASCGVPGGSRFPARSDRRWHSVRTASLLILIGALTLVAQPPGGRGGGGGPQRPAISSSVRLEDWALFRSAAGSVLGWKVGAPAQAYRQLTFSEAAAKVDALGLATIAGVSTQKFSHEIPKNLDYNLTPNELTAVRERLLAL